ncbi:MAG: aspartate carbamoyltransferase regulatory subunit [Muribaculaceae bacterium]|nr:aspartate carbamoyltransferase regulatory subunit [Muribaculaceae bacterium]
MNTKKELAVAALCNGTVIDHIPSEVLFKCVKILDIANMSNAVTIGNNLESAKLGRKGIIKIADTYFPEDVLNRIALLAPSAVINIIKNYEVTEKFPVSLPDTIHDIVKCDNPKCITNNEPMPTRFEVTNRADIEITCHYCGHSVSALKASIK